MFLSNKIAKTPGIKPTPNVSSSAIKIEKKK